MQSSPTPVTVEKKFSSAIFLQEPFSNCHRWDQFISKTKDQPESQKLPEEIKTWNHHCPYRRKKTNNQTYHRNRRLEIKKSKRRPDSSSQSKPEKNQSNDQIRRRHRSLN
ncbi:hypothetical protein NE237_003721 [Protea cynaroides]|uniref:Uncharacterized protein n=1 Tax=Protea cynaroides TaxID=273540 RepID=A0A9Q0KHJ8_9MAGN|nr:hypothetical protein NE237_003721 [Protea cynaroides]